ncbi:MAG: Fpg/Nei family DNA glycosylase [Acidobacteria bacterium]|nr:Fpg/Nei family DNA glycosylase [Acidobacteriota bacterium]
MPEGDTIFRTARTLERALAGRVVTAFETQVSSLAVVDRRAPLAGRTIVGAAARGKHLLVSFSGGLVLRTHLRMHGSWHIYRPGERWRAPARDARIVITTGEWVAIAFNVTDAELLTSEEVARHPRLSVLGPDLLADAPDLVEARERMKVSGAAHIADALLAQQAVAGLGNVYKSELLFLLGVYPFTPVDDVPDETIDALLARGRTLLRLNVAEAPVAGGSRAGRVTTGRLNPDEKVWVYGRAGEPCFRCGTPIRSGSETGGRRTYWCPTCQASSTAPSGPGARPPRRHPP